MNYVDHFNLFGVDAKQIACDTGKGAPTTSTVGPVGGFRMDTDTGDVYKCVAAVDGVYTWKNMGEPVLIDLDTYSYDGITIAQILLQMFANGGGAQDLPTDFGLFDDLRADRPVNVKFSFGNRDVHVIGGTYVTLDGAVIQFSFAGALHNLGAAYDMYAIAVKTETGMRFILNMEMLGSGSSGSADAVLYTPQDLTEEQKAQARENIGAETMITLDPSDYGIDMITALMNAMNGQIFTEIDCSAFINDVTAVFAKGNMLLISVPDMDVYGFINAFAPGYQIVASLAGRYSDTFIKADVMIFPEGIYMFANQLGVSGG